MQVYLYRLTPAQEKRANGKEQDGAVDEEGGWENECCHCLLGGQAIGGGGQWVIDSLDAGNALHEVVSSFIKHSTQHSLLYFATINSG